MSKPSDFRSARVPLSHGAGRMPVLGFGTLLATKDATTSATKDALEAGFRHFDCAERYRNEAEVGAVLQAGIPGGIPREELFVTTKLWNSNHRPERVAPAFHGSLGRLRVSYLDLYLMHTPYAFQPGRVGKTPAQVLLAWALQRGAALLTTPRRAERARENLDVSPLADSALREIDGIETRQRYNQVVKTGSPGFIPRGS